MSLAGVRATGEKGVRRSSLSIEERGEGNNRRRTGSAIEPSFKSRNNGSKCRAASCAIEGNERLWICHYYGDYLTRT